MSLLKADERALRLQWGRDHLIAAPLKLRCDGRERLVNHISAIIGLSI